MNDGDDLLDIDTVMEEKMRETQEDLPFLPLVSPELCQIFIYVFSFIQTQVFLLPFCIVACTGVFSK